MYLLLVFLIHKIPIKYKYNMYCSQGNDNNHLNIVKLETILNKRNDFFHFLLLWSKWILAQWSFLLINTFVRRRNVLFHKIIFFPDTTLLEDPILKLLWVIFHAVDKHGSVYDEIILIEKALKMVANLSPRVTQVQG